MTTKLRWSPPQEFHVASVCGRYTVSKAKIADNQIVLLSHLVDGPILWREACEDTPEARKAALKPCIAACQQHADTGVVDESWRKRLA